MILYDLIRQFEGCRLRPYRCPAGIWTIGFGHTGPEVTASSPPITREIANALMIEDAEKARRAALRISPILHRHEDRAAAVADFIFNLGATRYKASTLRRKVDAGDWSGAALECRKWVYGGGRKLPGLVLRREAEARLLA